MAFQTPAAVMLNENIQIHKGKRADAPSAKPLKPSVKPALQERKALQDVSNIPKGTALNNRSAVKERSILKDKSILKDRSILKDKSTIKDRSILKEKSILKRKPAHGNHEAIKNPVNVFADEETKKCHEWAKDGVEGTHFTGNDSQKLDKDMQDKCVQKKVAKVMSAFNGWSDVVFDPVMFPAKSINILFLDVGIFHLSVVLKQTGYLRIWHHKIWTSSPIVFSSILCHLIISCDIRRNPYTFYLSLEVAIFSEEVKELELEPEILPDNTRCFFTSGKRANAPTAKQLKSSVKPRLQERKALQDLSNTLSERKGHQDMSNTEKSILIEKSTLKNPLKILAVKETKCHEWAEDLVEGSHATGNYPQKLDKDMQEERDKAQLPEDSFTDDELDEYPFLDNNPVTFELRDEPGIPELRAN